MGWDDNGLPTERRVQNYFGVRCDPSLPYEADFTPPEKPDPKRQVPISRPNFVELCEQLVVEDEQVFEQVWRQLGLSVDWSHTYTTAGSHAREISQRAFLRNFARGEAYLAEAPTVWDVTDRTAVAQAEIEAREYPGAYHRVAYHRPDGSPVYVETTRPELIPSAVALIAHPDDERYQGMFGTTVTSPVFGVEIPVVAHHLAETDKGAGIAMCCTFGDLTDVLWWRELNLPVRTVIGRDGRFTRETPAWLSSDSAAQGPRPPAYERLAGKTVFSAREEMVAMLRESGDLDGEPTADDPDGELLRAGRQAARDRGDPAVVHPQRRPRRGRSRRDARARLRDHLAPGVHEDPLRQLGLRAHRRLADLAAAVLRHPVPGLVPARRRGRARPRPPAAAERGGAAGRPVDRCPARLHRGPARQAERLPRRPGRHGHLGDIVPEPADRRRLERGRRPVRAGLPDGPVHAGPRDHPHLAVLPRGPGALREPRHPLDARDAVRLDPRPRPQEDVEVQGQRGRPHRDPGQVRRRRGPLAGSRRAARHGLAVRRDPDEGRPPAGHEGAQRLQVRPGRRRRQRAQRLRGLRADRLRPARPAGQRRHCRHRGVRGLRLHERPGGDRAVLLGVLRRLPRAGQGARVRRGRRSRHRVGPRHAGARAPGPAPAARAVPALRHRGGLVVVAGGLDPPRSLADRGRPRRRRRRRPVDPRRRGRGPDRDPRRQVAGQGLDAPRAHQGPHLGSRAAGPRPPSSPPTTCARPAGSPAS